MGLKIEPRDKGAIYLSICESCCEITLVNVGDNVGLPLDTT